MQIYREGIICGPKHHVVRAVSLVSVVVYMLIASSFVCRAVDNEPLSLIFACSDANNNSVLNTHEVGKYFNSTSTSYVNKIVDSENCRVGKDGIVLGRKGERGALRFSLSKEYRNEICRVFLDYVTSPDESPTVSICEGEEVTVQSSTVDRQMMKRRFELCVDGKETQEISVSSSGGLCIVAMTIIYKDSRAAKGDVETIFIPATTRTLNIGGQTKIEAIVSPDYALDRTLNYMSSDESVVIVDEDGVATAIAKGRAVVTASSKITPSVYALVEINVVEIAPTSISYVDGERTVGVGGSLKFELEFIPSNAVRDVIWTTDYSDYFDLDQTGRIRAKKAMGAVNVCATSAVDKSVCKYCVFKIVDHLGVESVDVLPAMITLQVGEARQLSASVFPCGASDTRVEWQSTDYDVAEVDSNGNVIAKRAGQCIIKAVSVDNSSAEGMCAVSVEENDVASIEYSGSSESNVTVTMIDRNTVRISGMSKGTPLSIVSVNGYEYMRCKTSSEDMTVSLPEGNIYVISVGKDIFKISA